MNCAWDAFIRLLPNWLREETNKVGKTSLQEMRLRVGHRPELITKNGNVVIDRIATPDDLKFCINIASGYSPWVGRTIEDGYLTAPGGHRIGVCGEAIITEGKMTGIRTATMLCIRIARDFHGIANKIPIQGNSVLIIGKPGSGKTTLLRDMIRIYSNANKGSIGVVDERGEIFPLYKGTSCFQTGERTDIITGCSKKHGIDLLLRCMSPSVIAVDEITSETDCKALMQAAWCGVSLFATAHASSMRDLSNRLIYKQIMDCKVFDVVVILHPDKTWSMERVNHR